MADCPKCGSEIGKSSYCGCGWKRQPKRGEMTQQSPRCLCAYMGCDNRAIAKVKVSTTAWSNFCEKHYDDYFLAKAEERCAAMGLKTTEDKRQWVLAQINALAKKMRPSYLPEREPGED